MSCAPQPYGVELVRPHVRVVLVFIRSWSWLKVNRPIESAVLMHRQSDETARLAVQVDQVVQRQGFTRCHAHRVVRCQGL